MRVSEAKYARLWALGLATVSTGAALLMGRIRSLEIVLVFTATLAAVAVIGLLTNAWGGLSAGAVGVFIVLLITHAAGTSLRGSALASIAGELAAVPLVGLLAGGLSGAVERTQREVGSWLERAEELTVHDETLGGLKPEWACRRLEEEAIRASHFGRPLAVALLQLTPRAQAGRQERLSALQAVLRAARAALPPAAIVAHAGADQVLLVLPEHTLEQGRQIVERTCRQCAAGHYFSPRTAAAPLGRPVHSYGHIRAGLVALNGKPETADELLARVQATLRESPCLN